MAGPSPASASAAPANPNEEMIVQPHAHDVLCGRGGLTNQHAGNEWYRRLVRSNRPLYRSCPKHTKLLVSKAIVQAVQQQDPPGRFLEMSKSDNGMWKPIPYKRAVDKTSQALREKEHPNSGGGPVASVVSAARAELPPGLKLGKVTKGARGKKAAATPKNINDLTKVTLQTMEASKTTATAKPTVDSVVLANPSVPQSTGSVGAIKVDPSATDDKSAAKKRKASDSASFTKPSWWSKGTPLAKKAKEEKEEDPLPLPPAPLQARQSSMFRFLSQTGIFGSSSKQAPTPAPQPEPLAPQDRIIPEPFSNSTNNANNNNSSTAVTAASLFDQQSGPQLSMYDSQQQFQQQQQQQLSGATSLPMQMQQQSGALPGSTPFDVQMGQRAMPGNAGNMGMAAGVASTHEAQLQQQQQQMQASFDRRLQQLQAMSGTANNDNLAQQMQQRALSGTSSMAVAASAVSTFDSQRQQQQLQQLAAGGASGNFNVQLQQQGVVKNNVYGQMAALDKNRQNGTHQNNANMQFNINNQQGNMFGNMDPLMHGLTQDMRNQQQQQWQKLHQQQKQQLKQNQADPGAPPPVNRLASQMSGWLMDTFWPLDKDEEPQPPQASTAESPPPPVLEPGLSSTLLKLASTPSRLIENLKTGVTAYFDNTEDGSGDTSKQQFSSSLGPAPSQQQQQQQSMMPPPMLGRQQQQNIAAPPMLGTESAKPKSSLLDDYEDNPRETRLRSISSL